MASTGLMLTALFAGINPAKAPETIRTTSEIAATVRSTSGFLKNSDSPPALFRTDAVNSVMPTPMAKPKYPATVVSKTDSRTI